MTMTWRIPAACALFLVACDRGEPGVPAVPAVPAVPQFEPVADVRQLMEHIVEPAANVYWSAVGSVTDSSGTKDFAPTTNEQWEAVRNSAFVVAESGNLLMLPGRVRDGGDWLSFSRDLIGAAKKAIAAAEARDPKAVFDVGAEMYEACVQCHATYLVGERRPNSPRP